MPDEHYIWRNRICLVHTSFSRWFGSVALGKVSAEEQANIALYKTTFQAKLEDLLESLQANKVQAPQQVLPISFSPFFVSGGHVTTPAEPAEVVSSVTAEQEVPASEASFEDILHPQKVEAAEPKEPESTIAFTRAIQRLVFEGKPVEIQIEGEVEWWRATHVCAALGYEDTSQTLADHVDSKDTSKRRTLTDGGPQLVLFINESGLNALLMGSKQPRAKAFKHWVTADVLPSIRKTGQYSVSSAQPATNDVIAWMREMREEDRRSTERMFDRLAAAQERQERTVQAVFAMGTEVARAFGKFSSAIAAMDTRMITIERATVATANAIKEVHAQTTDIHGRSNGKITPKEYGELIDAISYLASLYVQAHMYDWYEEGKRLGAARFDIQNEVMKNAKHAGRPLTSLPSMSGVEAMDWLAERTHKLEKRLEVQTSTVTRAPTHLPGVEDDLAVARRNAAAITGTAEKDDKKKE